MEIAFSREWNKDTIRKVVSENCYLNFGAYEDLKAICVCPFAEDEEFYEPDYHTCIVVVPNNWLKDVVNEMFEVDDLDYWLKNEYTTDESEVIFERALNERKVVMIDFE